MFVNMVSISKKMIMNSKKLNLKFWPTSLILRAILRVAFQTYLFISTNGS
jgi:hypothetical protein